MERIKLDPKNAFLSVLVAFIVEGRSSSLFNTHSARPFLKTKTTYLGHKTNIERDIYMVLKCCSVVIYELKSCLKLSCCQEF